ncbi:MAG: hypothetical protein A2915_01840 [Candidatus Yanofskybacteria bacterium RIFCSPLOWO2_01_FULL_41_34]|uniref:DUF5658 domain-containing protein n=1 Tax=Candidatus Yanofskybacteria bacterium RIFCSPHIGHO2_01_FULL_41_26 TaxID=1802661 RepID=A0A1F8ECP2_9BACT|nr:MAG: hypothetical protein A2649_00460 [Candidatus Yanofskybacteria bacterium RIFCSPHIGHO2_01_FULL_41_26]OGN22975.1 MAG: hypothetical protein A2915_01840 [Candidatus Yanofskybacteria bacterium RIFCSPLOWO2_01_FULL_41_34]
MARVWQWLTMSGGQSDEFGKVTIFVFVLVQGLDGAFTYIGISSGISIEANPLMFWLMSMLGLGFTVIVAKLVAVGFGIILFCLGVHRVVAFLTAIYFIFALFPWSYLFLIR